VQLIDGGPQLLDQVERGQRRQHGHLAVAIGAQSFVRDCERNGDAVQLVAGHDSADSNRPGVSIARRPRAAHCASFAEDPASLHFSAMNAISIRGKALARHGDWRVVLLLLALAFLLLQMAAASAEPAVPGASAIARTLTPSQELRREARAIVRAVVDGDTVYAVIDGVSTRVRLAQIDAPEKSQAFGRRSEQALRELVWKREVRLRWSEADRYGRPIVEIDVDGKSVNAEMVRQGYAWVYRQYSASAELRSLEQLAREAGRGLWVDAHPIAPWDWRRDHKRPA
jgi:endonuclease YncB( thermonuclease family)